MTADCGIRVGLRSFQSRFNVICCHVFLGEANRFVASLVKNSHNSDVMKCVISSGSVKHLVAMSGAEHVLMQNEAIIALTLIVSSLAGQNSVCKSLNPTIVFRWLNRCDQRRIGA
jgi:hypothetical protein